MGWLTDLLIKRLFRVGLEKIARRSHLILPVIIIIVIIINVP